MKKITREIIPYSPFIQTITQVKYTVAMNDVTRPDGCWDLVVIKRHGETNVLITGSITKPVLLPYDKDDEYLCISFKPYAFLPHLSKKAMINNGYQLPKITNNSFLFGKEKWELPSFENADLLVEKFVDRGLLLKNNVVEAILLEEKKFFSERSMQRHFMEATGMTLKYFYQIQRAQEAMKLLQKGESTVQVAVRLGYYDQPHMTKSLKQIMGITPTELKEAQT